MDSNTLLISCSFVVWYASVMLTTSKLSLSDLFCSNKIFFQIFLTFIYFFFWDRERQHERGRVRGRGRHRIWNRLRALSCQHGAWRGARTHGPRDHDLSRSWMPNRLSHPGAPRLKSLIHFDFVSVCGVKYMSICFSVHVVFLCPGFLTPPIEETAFSSRYILGSFVVN